MIKGSLLLTCLDEGNIANYSYNQSIYRYDTIDQNLITEANIAARADYIYLSIIRKDKGT